MTDPRIALLAVISFLPLHVFAQNNLAPKVDAVFAAYDKPDSPGCALGVIRDGRLVYARGYGLANLEHRIPITPRTVFDIGSTSKQFTATSVVLLAQQKKLSLDDDIRIQYEFRRDGRGRIGGFAVQAGRIRNVRFDKIVNDKGGKPRS